MALGALCDLDDSYQLPWYKEKVYVMLNCIHLNALLKVEF